MDPFNKLPPEIRLEILVFIRFKRSIKQLIQASPTMLGQYMAYKEYIDRELLVTEADLDDDMVQDAMAIILSPPQINDDYSSRLAAICSHHRLWRERRFSNPLKEKTPMNEKDQKLVKDINKLYQQMLIFIEDYLTKATAACPSREYLCLPHPGGHLTFKTRTICTRFDIAQCNDTERRRLLRAFLKYELRCKFYVNDYKPWQLRWSVALGNLGQSDIEAISCVDTYFDSLYKAILAQCGDSDLPESPTVVHAYWEPTVECHCQIGISEQLSDLRGMLYEKVTLNSNELCRWLACFGFDLAATLVAGTTAGQRERAVVGQWLIDVAKRGARRGSDQSNFRHCRHTFSPAISANGMVVEDESYHDSSGLYQMLYPRFTVGRVGYMGDISKHIYCKKISLLYRSRAWAFLDDARLFKYQGEREWPYFLADDAVFPAIRFHDIIGPRQLCEWSWERQRSRPFSPETEIRNLSNAIAQAKV